jgi:hypothetical protein
VRRLDDPSFEDPSLEFISKCNDLHQKHADWTSSQVFSSVAQEYQGERPGRRAQEEMIRTSRGGARRFKEESAAVEEDDGGSISSELLSHHHQRRGGGGGRAPLVTKESLRSLFEEAKKTNNEEK